MCIECSITRVLVSIFMNCELMIVHVVVLHIYYMYTCKSEQQFSAITLYSSTVYMSIGITQGVETVLQRQLIFYTATTDSCFAIQLCI